MAESESYYIVRTNPTIRTRTAKSEPTPHAPRSHSPNPGSRIPIPARVFRIKHTADASPTDDREAFDETDALSESTMVSVSGMVSGGWWAWWRVKRALEAMSVRSHGGKSADRNEQNLKRSTSMHITNNITSTVNNKHSHEKGNEREGA